MTTHAPLRSHRTKAKSVCHVQGLADGDSPTSPSKDTRLLGVGSSAWFSDDAPQHPAWAMSRLASPASGPTAPRTVLTTSLHSPCGDLLHKARHEFIAFTYIRNELDCVW
jgi:hypothetical protein